MARKKYVWKFKNTVKHTARVWLNPLPYVRGGTPGGAVITNLDAKKGDRWAEVTLQIRDCSKICGFDLSVGTPADQKRSIKKLDKMIGELTTFRDAIASIKYEKKISTADYL